MQAVQLQQILPQMQLATQAKEVSAHADDSRFMDALKAQKSLQTQESERQEETGKTVSYQKNALSRSEESNKTSENQTDEKAKKIAKKTSQKEDDEQENAVASPLDVAGAESDQAQLLEESASKLTLLTAQNEATNTSAPEARTAEKALSKVEVAALQHDLSAIDLSFADKDALSEAADFDDALLVKNGALLTEAQDAAFTDDEAVTLEQVLSESAHGVAATEKSAPTEENESVLLEPLDEKMLSSALPLADQVSLQKESREPTAAKEKKADSRLTVHDLRTENAVQSRVDTTVQRLADKKEFNAAYQRDMQQDTQVTLELASQVNQNITASDTQSASATGSTFQSMLTNAVQAQTPDFVRAGSIVLQDNNQGSINLILHPESLGNVKIHLSLSDKVITGQITVHSAEAYEAFRESIDTIKQAFAQSGFDTGSFDLNFAGNNSFAQSGQGGEQSAQDSFRANAAYSDFVNQMQESAENAGDTYTAQHEYSVDIVA